MAAPPSGSKHFGTAPVPSANRTARHSDRTASVVVPVEPSVPVEVEHRVGRRLMLLLGLAYLMLTALTSGLAWTSYLGMQHSQEHQDRDGQKEREPRPEPSPESEALTPPSEPPALVHPVERDPHKPGLHTRPDGSRYLVVPLPAPWTGPQPATALAPGGAA